MAYIKYVSSDQVPAEDRVPDDDNIIRIHGTHSRVLRQHYDLYKELLHGDSPLTRMQREMIAIVVSAHNACHY